MELVAERLWRPTVAFTWKSLKKRCANVACASKHPTLNGLLKNGEGIRMLDRWYCGARCFEQAVLDKFQRSIATAPAQQAEFRHRMPLGLVMVARGLITHDHVKAALGLQAETGERVGQCLQKVAGISSAEVATAVGLQWSCPVYRGSVHEDCLRLIPKRLLDHYGMLPVQYVRSAHDLYIGFRARIDHTALYAVEQMLGCHTEPCVLEDHVLESAFAAVAENEDRDLVIDNASSAREMARITTSYAQQLRADEVRLVDCGGYAWVRVYGPRNTANLLFGRTTRSQQLQ